LLSGAGCVDYSFVTGEAEPVKRGVGERLFAGGRQVGGAIEIETVKPVSQSYLTSLWNHDAFAKEHRDPLNTLTNRYSRRFTLIVIAIALGALAGWWLGGDAGRGLKAFTSVLIVACPCALALAAPFTLGTAHRLLGQFRIFLKNSQVVERLARVNAIVFDKTGTLTLAGAGGVRFVGVGGELTPEERLAVHSLTSHSTHPNAVRVHEATADGKAPEVVAEFLETAGCGIEGVVRGQSLILGSRAWLETRGIAMTALDLPAGSAVYLAVGGRLSGAFVLASAVRPGVAALVRELKPGMRLSLLSGDNEKERDQFAALFGPDADLRFNQTPFDKLAFVSQLRAEGYTVMMVGDGLNDAGALRQADVGVAVVEKIGAFSPASDVIADGERVHELGRVLRFGRRAEQVVKLNFVVSALYNVVGVGIAASGLLSPVICAILMPLSSITVVTLAWGVTTLAARRERLVAG
jgi:Cu+-exporting ATPase